MWLERVKRVSLKAFFGQLGSFSSSESKSPIFPQQCWRLSSKFAVLAWQVVQTISLDKPPNLQTNYEKKNTPCFLVNIQLIATAYRLSLCTYIFIFVICLWGVLLKNFTVPSSSPKHVMQDSARTSLFQVQAPSIILQEYHCSKFKPQACDARFCKNLTATSLSLGLSKPASLTADHSKLTASYHEINLMLGSGLP